MTNSIPEIEDVPVLFVIGSNTTETHPVLALSMKKAVRKGSKLIVADPRKIDLVRFSHLHLRLRSGGDIALVNSMMHVIIDEGLYDREFVEQHTEGFEDLKTTVAKYAPEKTEEITGVPPEQVREAARLFAQAETAAIYYTMGITQHICGTQNVMTLSNLALLTGNVGKRSSGINPLRGQSNVQGACDMGALPDVYTGYQKVTDEAVRRKFEQAWGVTLPTQLGLQHNAAIEAMGRGEVRALYVMGEHPHLTDPDVGHARRAMEKLDLMVVQDLFLTETAKVADVVLPAAGWGEVEGTLTNTERRVQRVRAAVAAPGEARADTEIICDLASRLGYDMGDCTPAAVWDEIAGLTPSMAGINYQRLEQGGIQWPCPDETHPGTEYLHADLHTGGKTGYFRPAEHVPPAEMPDREYPLLLTTGRRLYHYHTGTRTHASAGLDEVIGEEAVELNPTDAQRLGISEGDVVRVVSRRGEVTLRAAVTDRSPPGTVFMSFHFAGAPVNVLTHGALDPVAGIPEYKVCAVRVECVARGAQVSAGPAAPRPGAGHGDGRLQGNPLPSAKGSR